MYFLRSQVLNEKGAFLHLICENILAFVFLFSINIGWVSEVLMVAMGAVIFKMLWFKNSCEVGWSVVSQFSIIKKYR